MVKAHERWGSVPFAKLLEPAIALAKKGFTVTARQAERINDHLGAIKRYSTFAPIPFLRSGAWKENDTLKRPNLAKTLKRIQDHKAAGFYQGKTARYIINEMKRCGGLITQRDLSAYMARFRDPIVTTFKGYKVFSMPPPSSGGIALAQLLKLVEPYPLHKWGLKSGKTKHIMTEAMKLVYADRSQYLGDPAFYNVPKKKLLDSAYLSDRRQLMGLNKTIESKNLEAGKLNAKIGGQTTHFSIVDEDGNAVSVTTTLNTPYGSKVYVGRAGFFLNSEMNDFSLKPRFPNVYGLRSGKANAIEPGKRMLSSMTPTIVSKKDSLYAVLGSPGGSTIITTVFQTLMNITVFDMPMQAAVNHGRFHHQWKPDYLLMEYNRPFQLSTLMTLYGKGHWVVPFPPIGSVDAIKVKGNGNLAAGADPRGDDVAMGY
jgi:gamma-glutamyltranspeptidase/glutathione hydrolase